MRYEHHFAVNAPLTEVVEFHRHASGLKALTPPMTFMKLIQVPDPIKQGDTLIFSMWLGPIRVTWESQFPEMSDQHFVDIQGQGPFGFWQHRHTFTSINEKRTEVFDEVEARLSRDPLKWTVGLIMWLTLPVLFWYRQIHTRRLLER